MGNGIVGKKRLVLWNKDQAAEVNKDIMECIYRPFFDARKNQKSQEVAIFVENLIDI